MPRQTHDQRTEEQDPNGRTWAQWLAPAMAALPIDVKTLVERARDRGATFDKTNVSRWLRGQKSPEPNHAVIVAQVLSQPPADALRAAGHGPLADAFAQSVKDARSRGRRDRETELREELAAVDEELATRLARYLPPSPPPSRLPTKQENDAGAS